MVTRCTYPDPEALRDGAKSQDPTEKANFDE